MNAVKSFCAILLVGSLSSTALAAPEFSLMGLTVGEGWASARAKIRAACAGLKGCDPPNSSIALSAGDWYTIRLADKVAEKECTRLEVDFVRRGRTLLVNEIAMTYLCAAEASFTAEQKLAARFGRHVDKKVQAFRTDEDRVVTNLLWGGKALSLADVLSNERMHDTVPGVYLRTPKEGATYLFASIDSSKASGASSVVTLVLTHGSLTSLRHELMVQAHTKAAVAVPLAAPGS